MTAREKRIAEWAETLSADQMRPLLVELVEFACDADYAHFGDLAPYWEATGDPLVAGQQPFLD